MLRLGPGGAAGDREAPRRIYEAKQSQIRMLELQQQRSSERSELKLGSIGHLRGLKTPFYEGAIPQNPQKPGGCWVFMLYVNHIRILHLSPGSYLHFPSIAP